MPEAILDSSADLIGFYNEKRAQAERRNRTFRDGDEERVEGSEGYVFYLLDGELALASVQVQTGVGRSTALDD